MSNDNKYIRLYPERDKDAVFVALCEIARNYIYDEQLATGESVK